MPNPFIIETLPPHSPFCDRQEEIERLQSSAESGTNLVLFSPRRYGKTSLALRVQAMLAKKGYVTIYCQLFGVDSVSDAASRMGRSILGAIHARDSLFEKGKRFLKYFSSFRPVFKPSEDGISVTVEPASDKKPLELLERILGELGEFAAKSGYRVNFVLDEFQEITRLKESARIEGVIRGKIQGQKVSYFFLGSRRGILLAMFSDRKRPFFQSAIHLELPPLPLADVTVFLGELFSREQKDCPETICKEISLMVNQHPYYVQRLAHEVYNLGKKKICKEDVAKALKNIIDMERYAFEAVLSRLTLAQVRVIRALAVFPTKEMLSGEFIGRCGLPPSSVQFARDRLKTEDLIEQEKNSGTWTVVDPVFSMWLKRL
ncbi:MAG: ATP-binding protein [Deltaproteobacteria bacterium]|nr:ATP-binding protein [Deltaproteobacteria bacterium]